MRSFLPSALVLSFLLAGCGGAEAPSVITSKGGRHYGGIFNWNEAGTLRSLFPLSLATTAEFRVASLAFQGLVRFDPNDLSVKPCLAERWEVDPTGTVYTFTLREDVRFHPDSTAAKEDLRPLLAEDVVTCFRKLCTAAPENQMFWLFQGRVKGADEHYAASLRGEAPGGLPGITAVDEHTLRVELVSPEPLFLQVLAHQGCWIYGDRPRSARRISSLAQGTGPFVLRQTGDDGPLVFERFAHYWEKDQYGNALPYLDGVRVTFDHDKSHELDEFIAGHLSLMVDPPVERLGELVAPAQVGGAAHPFVVQRLPGLSVQFYGFNALRPPFDDVLVRRAFALAIDQGFLADSVLKGAAVRSEHGVVPPGMNGYPEELVSGLAYDPDSARELLALAGYPGGKGFPTVRIQVNNDGFGYGRVAEAVQTMIERNLGIGLLISVLPVDQHYDRVDLGQAQLWRQGWSADYPDPENFLALFYGRNAVLDPTLPSALNTTRYHNARFDSLFLAARAAPDHGTRMRLLAQAEDQAMEDVTVAPLYFERTVRLLQPWVRGMPINAMDLRYLEGVWFDPAERN